MPALGYTYDDHLPADFSAQSLRDDVRTGLTAPRKWLPPKWFYDKVGSELFEDITALREYYPTRTERAILDESASAIVAAAGVDTLVELGSGSSEKTRLLLDAMLDRADGGAERRRHGGAERRRHGGVERRRDVRLARQVVRHGFDDFTGIVVSSPSVRRCEDDCR